MSRRHLLACLTVTIVAVCAAAAPAAPLGREARVTGLIRLCGGPIGVNGRPRPCSHQNGTVTVLGPYGHAVTAERTRDGRFSFSLPPGTYTPLARTGGTRGRRTVRLRPGLTLRANITIPVP